MDEMDNIKLTDFFTTEELNKYDIVIYEDVWFKYNINEPSVSSIIDTGKEKHMIIDVKKEKRCFLFTTNIL